MKPNDKSLSRQFKSSENYIIHYSRTAKQFKYSKKAVGFLGKDIEGKNLWEYLASSGLLKTEDAEELKRISELIDINEPVFEKDIFISGRGDSRFSFVLFGDELVIYITPYSENSSDKLELQYDELANLHRRRSFCSEVERVIKETNDTSYAIFYFDIIKFKAINDIFGYSEGDRLLVHIANTLKRIPELVITPCRMSADRFAFLADITQRSADNIAKELISDFSEYTLPFDINIGVYEIQDSSVSANTMLDRAIIAQSAIKGHYTEKINYYKDCLREEMLGEHEILAMASTALDEEQFIAYYQPQYNHSTGMLIGAEALVRWMHPEKGLIPPSAFIPLFEKNGFITKLDFYVFEQVCKFLRKAIDSNYSMIPISVNFSKNDIFSQGFVEGLEGIRKKYGIPTKHLHLEITESVLVGNPKTVNEIIKKLHECGYTIEMDDFGSAYSSLNVLRELDFDIIKLDMLFLSSSAENRRGGIILSSVINMAKWLGIPVIAEGVEYIHQADYLRSVGCNYVQGYLYSRPLPENEFEKLISAANVGALIPEMKLIDTMNSADFWNPQSQETLIFNNFVGGASIFKFNRTSGEMEILRVNKKYVQELGMNLPEDEIIKTNLVDSLLDDELRKYHAALNAAIDTNEEQECETWRNIHSACCGDELMCIRSNIKMIGKSESDFLFYALIRNVTAEKNRFNSMLDTEKRFKMASEQVNIYFWEYTVATREMRPCFRCMRDLGLPPVLRNYPDSAIERGIFPPEVADMYRDWHVQVANGVKELEAIIPLTADRVPFRVRYTTEFDTNGKPIKAYGSAALIVN